MPINTLLALGSLGIIVGSFLPWYTEVFSTGAKLVQYGLEDGIGYNSLLWGGVLLLLSIFAGKSTSKIKLGIEGLLSAYMVLFGIGHIILASDILKHSQENYWGPGLWILVTGAVVHFVAFLFSLRGDRIVTRTERSRE